MKKKRSSFLTGSVNLNFSAGAIFRCKMHILSLVDIFKQKLSLVPLINGSTENGFSTDKGNFAQFRRFSQLFISEYVDNFHQVRRDQSYNK